MSKQLKLLKSQEIARGTFEVHFEKPADFSFIAGQNINLKVPELRHEDAKGPRRTFTLASAPHEKDLIIATRMTGSGFKKTLLELPAGTLCDFIGPQGKFTLEPADEKAAFLAGGIGITPFRSILLDIERGGKWPQTRLLYGNADLAGSAYHDLLVQLSERNPVFRYIPAMTNLQPEDTWPGERRMMTAEVIQEHVPDWLETAFYLCGPPRMVTTLTGQLLSLGVVAEMVRSESLFGY